MGNVALAAKALCEGLEIPYVVPEENNKKTLLTGSYYSPEEICLPFKLMLGNLIHSIEKGADTVLTTGSCGPCRFGEYCELQMKILRNIGYRDLNFIVADLSSEIGFKEFSRRIGKISSASPASRFKQIKALQNAYKVVSLCDKIDAEAHYLAGFEANRGQCKRLLSQYKAEALQLRSPDETLRLLRSYRDQLKRIEIDRDKNPLKVSIIGEIFTVIEPFSNLYIEEKLMDYGVSSTRLLSPSWWVRDTMLKPLKLNSPALNRAASRYLPFSVGGHGRECVGEAVLAKEHRMDGAIQIFPLGCMPEVIAKSVLPTIRRELDLPVMTLVVDEITGEAGYVTRIEAFVDMLEAKKRQSAGAGYKTIRPEKKQNTSRRPKHSEAENPAF